jgi:hypothetical protein
LRDNSRKNEVVISLAQTEQIQPCATSRAKGAGLMPVIMRTDPLWRKLVSQIPSRSSLEDWPGQGSELCCQIGSSFITSCYKTVTKQIFLGGITMTSFKYTLSASALALMAATGSVQAAKLTLYCSADDEFCQVMARGFEAATGIDVNMTRKSSGETFAQIKAESSNPKGDVWWGGTGDPHLQAAEEGLTMAYVSPMRSELHPWALGQAAAANDKTIGI